MNYIFRYIDHSRSMYLVNPSYTLVVESHARPAQGAATPPSASVRGPSDVRCRGGTSWHVARRQKWATPKKLVI